MRREVFKFQQVFKLQYLPLFAIAFFVIVLATLSVFENPLNRPTSIIDYPYVVSTRPELIGTGETTTIRAAMLNGSLVNVDTGSLFIITPEGGKLETIPSITELSTLVFPRDFSPGDSRQIGHYAIMFVPNNSRNDTLRLDFSVVSSPPLTAMYNFVFGNGLIAMFGLVGSVAAYLYQLASARKSESERIASEKTKWITENMRNYIMLTDEDADIFKKLEKKVNEKKALKKINEAPTFSDDEATSILYGMILYCRDYDAFIKEPGVYYFDDYTLEYFLSKLGITIFATFKAAINDEDEELLEFKDKRLSKIKHDATFIKYRGNLKSWLAIDGNARKLYLNHLMHNHVLLLGINKALLITYSDKKKLKQDLEKMVEKYRDDLNSGIKSFCKDEFNDESYYTLFNKADKLDL